MDGNSGKRQGRIIPSIPESRIVTPEAMRKFHSIAGVEYFCSSLRHGLRFPQPAPILPPQRHQSHLHIIFSWHLHAERIRTVTGIPRDDD